jgi:hypothetical protein
VTEGDTATFRISASGNQPLTYQWHKNGVNIPGANRDSYRTPATTLGDDGSLFDVLVTDAFGATALSNTARLTVNPAGAPPSIVVQPASVTVRVGRTARFSVSANGTLPLSYQWRKNGSDIAGASGADYQTPPATLDDDGAVFTVLVSNSFGNVLSDGAVLHVH